MNNKGIGRLGDFLKAARERQGLSQDDVAAKLGYSLGQYISNWEREDSSMPIKRVRAVAKLYGISANKLFRAVVRDRLARMEIKMHAQFGPVLLLIGLGALGAGFSRGVSQPAPEPTVSPSPLPSTIPQMSGIEFQSVAYYTTPAERVRVAAAARKVVETVQSKCFRDFMSARAMIHTHERSPRKVAEHLQGLTGIVPVKFYYSRFSSAVAYRQPPSLEINMNRKFFGSWSTPCELASTLGHEGLGHAIGEYDHDYEWNAQRDFSVPYSINKAFEKCCV